MTTRISIDSNIGSVIQSVDDLGDDLEHNMEKRVGAAMRILEQDVRTYVTKDPDYTGSLLSSIGMESSEVDYGLDFAVQTDASIAPYAAIVEFGTGRRTNVPFEGGNQVPPGWPDTGSAVPVGFPFDAPDIRFNRGNPLETDPYPKYYGFIKHIEDWMRRKPVQPHTGNYFASAAFIAAAIIRRGNHAHPFMRPAWFDNELQIRRAAVNALRATAR